MENLRKVAIETGMEIAIKFFAKRRGTVEAHLSKADVAALVALGYEMGAQSALRGKAFADALTAAADDARTCDAQEHRTIEDYEACGVCNQRTDGREALSRLRSILTVALIGLGLALSGCTSPTGPSTPSIAPDRPMLFWTGATPSQQEYGNRLWIDIAGCVGIDPHVLQLYPVEIVQPPMWCGVGLDGKPYGAAGCFDWERGVKVTADLWRSALWYEFLHVALWKADKNFDGFAYQPGSGVLADLVPTDMANPAYAACHYLRRTP